MKNPDKIKLSIALVLFTTISTAQAADILGTVNGINNLLYGIAAGIAVLMITMHAIKWKTSETPTDREEAKKGMINVILATVLIMITASLVSVLFVKPPEAEASPTTTFDNGSHSTTTTIIRTTTTTTTTISTIPPEKLLTAQNLVDCVNSKHGRLITSKGCVYCKIQRCSIFERERNPPVGPGLPEYYRLNITGPTGPRWLKNETSVVGCQTMAQLNAFFECGLEPVPGYVYRICAPDPGKATIDCD